MRSLSRRRAVDVAVRVRAGRGSLKCDVTITGAVVDERVLDVIQRSRPAITMSLLRLWFALDSGARALVLTPNVNLSLQKGRNGTMR